MVYINVTYLRHFFTFGRNLNGEILFFTACSRKCAIRGGTYPLDWDTRRLEKSIGFAPYIPYLGSSSLIAISKLSSKSTSGTDER